MSDIVEVCADYVGVNVFYVLVSSMVLGSVSMSVV